MLTLRVGHDTDYLTDAVAKGREGYYTGAVAAGEPPGLWHGRGAAALGLVGEVDADMMKALYTHGLDPRDPATASRETWHQAARYGNPPRNYKNAEQIYAELLEAHPQAGPEGRAELRTQAARSARQSVAFYDVVLSATKSQTLLWVACERASAEAAAGGDEAAAAQWKDRAELVEESLMVAHRGVLDFLAEKAGYARAGHHGGGGGEWVDAHDITSAQFLQHDSRDHDPQLHVHGPVANKALCGDGRVRALDFTLFTQWREAAGAYGERLAEAYLREKLGTWWETRPDGKSREIVGVDAEESRLFSKRTAAITPTLDGLITRFREETGRAPTPRERSALADQATLATRRGKVFGGETRDGQLARWAAEYDARFGRDITTLADQVIGHAPVEAERWTERDVITRALAAMEGARQSWTRSNLMKAVSDALPAHLGVAPDRVLPLLEGLTDTAEALARHLNPHTGPEGLDARYYRADGESVFVKPHSQRFATPAQLLGEEELRAAAVTRGAPTWTSEAVDDVVDRFTRAGRTLSTDQETALRGILTSGAAVEVVNAPAGTGKSFLVGTLADIWPLTGAPLPPPGDKEGGGAPPEPPEGGPRVFGVAYGQRQAAVLAEEGVTARNIRSWLDGQARLQDGRPKGDDEAFRLRPGDMLVVDEAGAAANPDLVEIKRRTEQAGAKMLLVGDTKQLSSPGAGGALADIAERGICYDLAEVRRFTEAWEGPASLRLRDGDPAAVGEYVKHGRLVDAGTVEQAEQQAARQWLADTLDGRDALLVVGSNTAASRVSQQLRADLVRLGKVDERGAPLGMPGWEGAVAGVGDLVQARRNAWHLEGWAGNAEAPVNRQTYRVTDVAPDGQGLTVARVTGRDADGAEQLANPIQLPAPYVRDRLTLAYASTVHAAHGRTVGTSLGVFGPGTDAAAAYVQATRGRDSNMLFVVTRSVSEAAETGETYQAQRRDAAQVVADAIRPPDVERDRTALTEAEQTAERNRAMPAILDPLVAVIADTLPGRTERWLDHLAATGELSEHHRLAFAADEARSSVDALLRTAELAGHDPERVLHEAVTATSLDGATSVAQVLHFRIREAYKWQLVPQVHSYADLLPRHLDEANRAGLEQLAAAADARRDELGAQLAEQPPQWAREALGPVPDVVDDPNGRADWERRAGWAGSYRELVEHTDDADALGAAPRAALAEKHAVFRAAHTALDLAELGADEENLSEGALRARVVAWDREQRWAPRYVADELEATHEALRQARADATVWAGRADAEPDPLVRDELRVAAEQARDRAGELAEQVSELEEIDHARDLWLIETAVTHDEAERSRVAAGWRGIDLDNPADRVNGDEWLDAHLDAQAADDVDREVTENDLDVDDVGLVDEPAVDDSTPVGRAGPERGAPAVEAVVPDIREIATPDPAERTDSAARRRVPPRDLTAEGVERARAVVIEVTDRAAAAQADDARTAEIEPDEDARRNELNRWADLAAAEDSVDTDETQVLDRHD